MSPETGLNDTSDFHRNQQESQKLGAHQEDKDKAQKQSELIKVLFQGSNQERPLPQRTVDANAVKAVHQEFTQLKKEKQQQNHLSHAALDHQRQDFMFTLNSEKENSDSKCNNTRPSRSALTTP